MVRDLTNRLAFPGPFPANGKLLGVCTWGLTAYGVDENNIPYAWSEQGTERDYAFPGFSGMWAYIIYSNFPGGTYTNGPISVDPMPYEFWEERTPYSDAWTWENTTGLLEVHERLQITLRTGGKRRPKWQNFFHVDGSATKYPTKDSNGDWIGETVSPGDIKVLGKQLDGTGMTYPLGRTYKALADNTEEDLTPVVECPRYQFTVAPQKHTLVLGHHCPIYGDTTRTDLGVGEQVGLSFSPDLVTNTAWTCTWSTTVGSLSRTSGNWTALTAPSNATSATVTATLGDEKVDVGFGVVEPSGVDHATVVNCDNFLPGVSGAGMHLLVYLAPTNVSFYRVMCKEVPGDASEISGYYTNWSASNLGHTTNRGAGTWFDINCDNSWERSGPTRNWDHAGWQNQLPPPQYSTGHFKWVIPGKWKIDGGPEHEIHFSDEEFWVDSAGTMTVKKFEKTQSRAINQSCSY